MSQGNEDLEEVEEYRENISDYSFADLVDELVQLRIELPSKDDLTEKSKINLKIREVKRKIDNRFLRSSQDQEKAKGSEGVSSVSELLSI